MLGLEHDVASIRPMSGGYVADVWLVTYADGTRVVAKTMTGSPADMFRAEADGLAALRTTGCLRTPEVLAVTDQLILLEALAARDDSESSMVHLGDADGGVQRLRRILAPFYPR